MSKEDDGLARESLLTADQIEQMPLREKLRRILKAVASENINECRVERALEALEGLEPDEQNSRQAEDSALPR